MDNLTHSLVGALIGQAGLKRKTGLAMPALIIGANIPDIDAACFLWLEGVQHLAFRRGITHGPPAWLLLPLVLAGALLWFDRWQGRRGKRPAARLPVRFGWLYTLALIACLTHPALDWLNSYGIRLLEPFSSRWFYGDTLFIIDVWLWLGLGLALWLSLRREKKTGGNWRRPARVAIVAAVAYIGFNGVLSAQFAKHSGPPDGGAYHKIASPVPFAFWKRDVLWLRDEKWWQTPQSLLASFTQSLPITSAPCVMPDLQTLRASDPDLDAFLFWSRAPFAERADDGSVEIRDARFTDPRVGDGFTVALPDVRCVQPGWRAAR